MSDQGDEESRWLAGQRAGRDGTEVEYIRRLTGQELTALRDAEAFLTSLTTHSAHQRMVERYEAFERAALYAERADPSEAADDRMRRMDHAFRAFLQAAVERRVVAEGAPNVPGSPLDSATWLAAESLAGGSRLVVANGPDGKQVAAVSDEPVDVPNAPQPVYAVFPLAYTLLQDSELLHARTLLGAAEAVDEASMRVRMLAAEVPLGTPLITGVPPQGQTGTFQFRYLPTEEAIRAQQAVRNARDVLTSAGTPGHADRQGGDGELQGAGGDAPRDSQHPVQGGAAKGTAPPPPGDQTGPPAQLAGDGDGEAGKEQDATWTSDVPLVDLSQLARHLATQVSVVEQLWSDAVSAERLQEAASQDRDRFSAVAAAVLRVSERAEHLSGPGARLQHGFPLPAHVVAAMPPQPGNLSGAMDGLLYGLTAFLGMLDRQAFPTEVDTDPEGQVLRVLFQPGATDRVKGHALLLARCVALVDDIQSGGGIDEQAEEQRLADAALDASQRGQPEAALLYTHLALSARATRVEASQRGRAGDPDPPVTAGAPVVPVGDLADNAGALIVEMLRGVPAIRLLPAVLATVDILIRHLHQAHQGEEPVAAPGDSGHRNGGDQDEDGL